MLRLFSLLLVLFFTQNACAQYLNTIKFSKEETHRYNGIKGLFEDQNGYIWVFGLDGISRFNGQHFETIEELYPNSQSLPAKTCFSMLQNHGYLWIGTSSNGLYALDEKGELKKFRDLSLENKELRSSGILHLQSFEDLLIINGEKGIEIFRKQGDLYESVEVPIPNPEIVVQTFVHENSLWISDDSNLWKLNLINFEISNYTNFTKASFFTNPSGKLWISFIPEGTRLAFYSSDSDEWKLSEYQPYINYKLPRRFSWLDQNKLLSFGNTDLFLQIAHFDEKKIEHIDESHSGLKSERFIRNSFMDKQGRNWLFGNELYLLPESKFITSEFYGSSGEEILDMIISPQNIIASNRNRGLLIYSKRNKTQTGLHIGNSDLADNYISQLVDFGSGRIGLCMMNYFQVYDESAGFGKAFKMPGIVRSAYETSEHFWVGGFKNLLKITKSTGDIRQIKIPSHLVYEGSPINDIFYSEPDALIVATANDKIMKFDLKNEEFNAENFMLQLMMDSFTSTRIIDADESPSGNRIALATDIGIFYQENGKKFRIPMQSTSYSNVIFHSDSILYATSKNEIYRINLETKKVNSFDKFQGLTNNYFMIRSSYKDKEGNLYFGGDQGIDKIEESKFNQQNRLEDLVLDQLFFNGVSQYPKKKSSYSVSSKTQVIELKLNSPTNFTSNPPELQTKFSSETGWRTLPSNETFTLYNPSPGKMAPKFRFLDQNGHVSSEEFTVELDVLQDWYKRPIFWIISILLFSGLSAFIYFRYDKERNDRKLRNLELQEELATLKLTSLNAQMNPHFIFNALSAIQQLIASGETEVAEDYLSKFSRLLRHVIQYASFQDVAIEDEIDFIRNYLDLELLRFEKAFKYEIINKIKDPTMIKIPPFFIQPQIENAVKHGLINMKEPGHIFITFSKEEERIKIIIEDNGIGRKAAAEKMKFKQNSTTKGNFLTQERIDNLNKLNYDSAYLIEDIYEDGKPKGTRITLEFENEHNSSK